MQRKEPLLLRILTWFNPSLPKSHTAATGLRERRRSLPLLAALKIHWLFAEHFHALNRHGNNYDTVEKCLELQIVRKLFFIFYQQFYLCKLNLHTSQRLREDLHFPELFQSFNNCVPEFSKNHGIDSWKNISKRTTISIMQMATLLQYEGVGKARGNHGRIRTEDSPQNLSI